MQAVLETDCLRLRPIAEDDAGRLFELDSDPEVMRYIGPYRLPDEAAYRDDLRTNKLPYYRQSPGRGFWALIEKATGEFLGWVFLRPGSDYRFHAEAGFGPDDVELGYRLHRAAWGKGYATEAARVLVRRAFDGGAVRVVASALVGNRASTRVMEKVGLRFAGLYPTPGYDQPSVKYALRREDFEPEGTG